MAQEEAGRNDNAVPLYASRYPGYDVLAQQDDWDDLTRKLVLKRLHDVPERRFFTEREEATLEAFANVVLPQDDRPFDERIPLVRLLDERLHEGKGPGWRIEEMPPEPEFWRTLAAALDDEARLAFDAADYPALEADARVETVRRVVGEALRERIANPSLADFGGPAWDDHTDLDDPVTTDTDAAPLESSLWAKIPLKFAWFIVLWEFVAHYYGHPLAWSEIGFGGPKFPHIYPRTLRANPGEAEEVDLGPP